MSRKKKRQRRWAGAPIIPQSPIVHAGGIDFVILPSSVVTIPGRPEADGLRGRRR